MLNGPYYWISTSELTLVFLMTRTLNLTLFTLLDLGWNDWSMYQTLKMTIHISIEGAQSGYLRSSSHLIPNNVWLYHTTNWTIIIDCCSDYTTDSEVSSAYTYICIDILCSITVKLLVPMNISQNQCTDNVLAPYTSPTHVDAFQDRIIARPRSWRKEKHI